MTMGLEYLVGLLLSLALLVYLAYALLKPERF
jgi:K+-transporting ATPase KdpF subunit